MATLNYAFKEISCKIVYYGCGLCGKTTNLIHVHKTVPGKFRGELVSLATEQDRTLFFDFLPLDLGEVKGFKTKFQLYTVPGQVYYNATRKLVLRGVDGLVFVVDSQKDRLQENVESFENLRQNLNEYGYHLQLSRDDDDGIPWVLQLNKRDMPHISPAEEIIQAMGLGAASIPTYESVALTGGGVKETLKGISSLVISKLNTGQPAAATPRPAAAVAAGSHTAPPVQAAEEDEYEAVSDEDLSDESLERPVAPKRPITPPSPAAPAAPKPVVAKQPASVPPPAPETPSIQVTQDCDGIWRGVKSGSGVLNLANINGTTEYQLTGFLSFAILFKRSFSRRFEWKGTEKRYLEGREVEFHRLEPVASQEGPAISMLVRNDESRNIYLTYLGFGGEVSVLPCGQSTMP